MIPKSRSSLRGGRRLLLAFSFLAIAACSSDEEEIPETPAEELYYTAFVTMQDEKLLTVRQHQIALARALRGSVDAHFAAGVATRKA